MSSNRSQPKPAIGSAEPAATREQLLVAAAGVFAESGFRAATVREICRRAGANLAAVNYHFRDKEGLYAEVLRRNYQRALERFPPHGGTAAGARPADQLRAFVRSFLLRIFSEGLDSCHGRLLAREMIDPTPALDALVATEIRALADHLMAIVRRLVPRGTDEATARFCMASVVSQIVFYHHCEPVIRRLFPELEFDPSRIDTLTDHITRFSLAGIRTINRLPATEASTAARVPTPPRRARRGRLPVLRP